jgi:uncharacterized Tic20 family protein
MSDMDPMNQGSATGGGQMQAGWYPDPTNGRLRWWDGAQWGQFQEPGPNPAPVMGYPNAAPSAANSASQAGLAHYLGAGLLFLSCGGLGWLGPLIIFLGNSGQNDPFVRQQSAEALNFQIIIAAAMVISYVLVAVVIGLVLAPLVWLFGIIMGVIAGSTASKGEAYKYPFNIQLVKP